MAMTENVLNLYEANLTVGGLKAFLKDIPDNTYIYVNNVGDSGMVESAKLEKVIYNSLDVPTCEVELNIEANSAYVY